MWNYMVGLSGAHHVVLFMGFFWVALGVGLVALVWGLKHIQGRSNPNRKRIRGASRGQ